MTAGPTQCRTRPAPGFGGSAQKWAAEEGELRPTEGCPARSSGGWTGWAVASVVEASMARFAKARVGGRD